MAEQQKDPEKDALPEAFFHAVAYLLPGLNQVAQKCGITIGEWIILWNLQQAGGVLNKAGQPTLPRQDLTELLAKRGFGEANISRLLNSLENKELIRRTSLTHREREILFGASHGGNRQAVVLQASGDKKIQEFKKLLNSVFNSWRSERSVMIQRALESVSGIGLQIAEWFFKGAVE
jgi:DNA-binding MarR family transcriptional regulator